jgi:hypothetical protein
MPRARSAPSSACARALSVGTRLVNAGPLCPCPSLATHAGRRRRAPTAAPRLLRSVARGACAQRRQQCRAPWNLWGVGSLVCVRSQPYPACVAPAPASRRGSCRAWGVRVHHMRCVGGEGEAGPRAARRTCGGRREDAMAEVGHLPRRRGARDDAGAGSDGDSYDDNAPGGGARRGADGGAGGGAGGAAAASSACAGLFAPAAALRTARCAPPLQARRHACALTRVCARARARFPCAPRLG